jgi:hypothetical protein
MGQTDNSDKVGIVQLKTNFYNIDGTPMFVDILKIWYKDSVAIEEVNRTNTVTDIAGVTTVNYELILYRYIDLKTKTLYDYKSLTDTAKIVNKASLPDTMMKDYGWSFYSDKIILIQGQPEMLIDTIIENEPYKRIKYSLLHQDPKKNFDIGYLKCDGKQSMFSLEKHYSRKINCTMVKNFSFQYGNQYPYASREVSYISDTLSKQELKVFEAWERNAKNNPISKK